MSINNPLWDKLRTGEIDANDQQLFLSILLKGLIYNLNETIKVRKMGVPHYILNTGDDIFYLEVKGEDHSIEPLQNSNEQFVYNIIPRGLIQPGGVDIQTDQLTSPYSNGRFEFEYDDMIYEFIAEFRRLPLKLTVTVKYILDNFTDALQATQQILTKLAFINKFNIVYLGQTIPCSYNIPTSYNTEYSMEFDGLSTDSKNRIVNVELEIDTNLPIIYNKTLMPADAYIKDIFKYNNLTGENIDFQNNHTMHGGITLYPKGALLTGEGENGGHVIFDPKGKNTK